jgi:UrcA family protein
MKQILNTMTLAAFVGLASFANFANSAVAGDLEAKLVPTDVKSVVLRFSDLNPAQPADAARLLNRVKIAARKACIRNDEGRQIFLGADIKACIADSYANTVAAINAKRNLNLEAVAARHDDASNLSAALR